MSLFLAFTQLLIEGGTAYAAVYATLLLAGFTTYCYLIHRSVYGGIKPKYPMVPSEGRIDMYCPRTDIPRPVYEDVRRYAFFEQRKKKMPMKAEREKRRRGRRNGIISEARNAPNAVKKMVNEATELSARADTSNHRTEHCPPKTKK